MEAFNDEEDKERLVGIAARMGLDLLIVGDEYHFKRTGSAEVEAIVDDFKRASGIVIGYALSKID